MRDGAIAAAAFAAGLAHSPAAAPLLDWPDLLRRPLPAADARAAYGPGPDQFAEVFRPAGAGPFPVVFVIHGGCWQSDVASRTIMNYAADDLRRAGLAVWNVEYRGVDRPGGGYPGTFDDIAAAARALAAAATQYRLRTDDVVLLGHSAGGHLALWLAARHTLPPRDPLAGAPPFSIRGVVSLGGLPDLGRAAGPCGKETVAKLIGLPSPLRPHPLADTSPAAMGEAGLPEILIAGDDDPISPPALNRAYAAERGRTATTLRTLPDTGHVELITPGTPAWTAARDAVLHLAEGRRER